MSMPGPFAHPDIPAGLCRATDGTTIRVLYARGGMVSYWEVTDPDTADDPSGKVLLRMTVETFEAAGYAPLKGNK